MTKTVLTFSGPITQGELLRAYQRLEKAEASAKAARVLRLY